MLFYLSFYLYYHDLYGDLQYTTVLLLHIATAGEYSVLLYIMIVHYHYY